MKLSVIELFDTLLPIAPIGLFFGRLANFINGELAGRITDVPWAVIFSRLDAMPRHPSPLYEALGEGVFLGLILYCAARYQKRGLVSVLFLIGYGLIRCFLEVFREPDVQIGFIANHFTLGQVLSGMMMVVGMVLMVMVVVPQLTDNKHHQKAHE